MSRPRSEWQKRDDAAKRAKAVKAALLRAVNAQIERLWATCNADGSAFTPAERKAVADASHAIRGIVGGWIARGRR